MTTLKASSLRGLLDKARNVGIIEESLTLLGHDLVIRNLPPEAYTEIYQELAELDEGVEYMHAHQIEHVCRSICEIDGHDFRDVKFIEVEPEEDPDNPEKKGLVNVPRHEWIRDNLVLSWGREALHVAYRKFMDAASEAENQSKEGVTFKVADETDEEKFRRLLMEAMAATEDLPDDMKEAILQEHGLLLATSEEELERANEQAKQFLEEQRAKQAAEEAAQAAEEADEEPPPVPQPPPKSAPTQVPQQLLEAEQEEGEPTVTPQELMARRAPMNKTPIHAPVPRTQEPKVVVANKRSPAPPPDQIAPNPNQKAAERIAALEAEAGLEGVPIDDPAAATQVYRVHPESAVLEQSIKEEIKPSDKIPIDRRPRGGVNKKFVDGTKGLHPRNRRG